MHLKGVYVLPGLSIVIVAASLVLGGPGTSAAQRGGGNAPTSDVRIVNTPGEPVPTTAQGVTSIAGAVSVSNVPAVSVTNTPSVFIANSAGSPVLVQDLAEISREPARVTLTKGGGTYDVPAGKRFVVEWINGFAELVSPFDPVNMVPVLLLTTVDTRAGLGPHSTTLALPGQWTHPVLAAWSQKVQIYLNPGEQASVDLPGIATFHANLTLEGYFLNVP